MTNLAEDQLVSSADPFKVNMVNTLNQILAAISALDQKTYALEVAVTEIVEVLDKKRLLSKHRFLEAAKVRASYGNFNYLLRTMLAEGSLTAENIKEKIVDIAQRFPRLKLQKTILPQVLQELCGDATQNILAEIQNTLKLRRRSGGKDDAETGPVGGSDHRGGGQ